MNTELNISNSDHQTMIHIEDEPTGRKRAPGGGRKGIPIVYRELNEYIECTALSKGKPLVFKIDKDDLEKVKAKQWYAASGGNYMACHLNDEGTRKMLYLHNFVMNRLTFPGKGTKESVDHINRDGLDNRKSNLRVVSQSEQNVNKRGKPRTCVLPEGCGILVEDIPKHIWYIKASGHHGDRFGIDLKTQGIKWKSSSSKSLTLKEKLEQSKAYLEELI